MVRRHKYLQQSHRVRDSTLDDRTSRFGRQLLSSSTAPPYFHVRRCQEILLRQVVLISPTLWPRPPLSLTPFCGGVTQNPNRSLVLLAAPQTNERTNERATTTAATTTTITRGRAQRAREIDDRDVAAEARRQFKSFRDESDPLKVQMLVADAVNHLEAMQGSTRGGGSADGAGGGGDSWLDIHDPADKRGRVGEGFPWQR
ncbi:unnamed protein product [Scytosiphon promiscuus]